MTAKPTTLAECEDCDDLIDRAIDGDRDAHAQLEARGETCPECVGAYENLLRTKRALATLPMLECPDRVLAAVDQQRRVARRATAIHAGRYAAAALAVAATLVIALTPRQPAAQPLPSEAERVAEARQAIAELRDTLADNRGPVGARTLRRGFVEPVEKTLAIVGGTKLGEWGAAAGALLDAVSPTPASERG